VFGLRKKMERKIVAPRVNKPRFGSSRTSAEQMRRWAPTHAEQEVEPGHESWRLAAANPLVRRRVSCDRANHDELEARVQAPSRREPRWGEGLLVGFGPASAMATAALPMRVDTWKTRTPTSGPAAGYSGPFPWVRAVRGLRSITSAASVAHCRTAHTPTSRRTGTRRLSAAR
jgi:hypothetical protein